MATARRCQGCGATLGDDQNLTGVITCPFCGLTHDVAAAGAGTPFVVHVDGTAARAAGGRLAAIIVAIVFVAIAGSLAVAWFWMRAATGVIERVATTTTSSRTGDARAPMAPADLAALPAGGGWRTLDVPAPPGGFDAFDPVVALPWAMNIGRAWATDAVLTRVDVGRVSATGVVDLGGEQATGYRFVSPGRQTQRKQELDAGGRGVTSSELMVQLKNSRIQALVSDSTTPPPAAAAASLGLDRILEGARRGRGFLERPLYSGYMIHLPREGWVWYLQTPSGDSLPRIRARDAKAYPY